MRLQDAMGFLETQKTGPPRLAARFWDEFSGKQKLLSSFFGKKSATSTTATAMEVEGSTTREEPKAKERKDGVDIHLFAETVLGVAVESSTSTPSTTPSSSFPTSQSSSQPCPSSSPTTTPLESCNSNPSSQSTKRKATSTPETSTKSSRNSKVPPKKIQRTGSSNTVKQAKLSSFFSKPSTGSGHTTTTAEPDITLLENPPSSQDHDASQVESDYLFALSLSQSSSSEPSASQSQSHSQSSTSSTSSKTAWSQLLAPLPPPKCTIHQEPAKVFTVNKTGPNKGRNFYLCSRYVAADFFLWCVSFFSIV